MTQKEKAVLHQINVIISPIIQPYWDYSDPQIVLDTSNVLLCFISSTYLLSSYYLSGIQDTAVNKINETPCPQRTSSQDNKYINKHTIYYIRVRRASEMDKVRKENKILVLVGL